MPHVAQRVSRRSWLEIVHQQLSVVQEPLIQRSHPRRRAMGRVRLLVSDPESSVRGTHGYLVDVSPEGCMIRTDRELSRGTAVDIEITLGTNQFFVRGTVMHSTGTVGGFKTGIKLKLI